MDGVAIGEGGAHAPCSPSFDRARRRVPKPRPQERSHPFGCVRLNGRFADLSLPMSAAASLTNHSRKAAILGKFAVAFGHTIQYEYGTGSSRSNGRTSRPAIRSEAASAVRASDTPCP